MKDKTPGSRLRQTLLDFEQEPSFKPTNALPGSLEKFEVLCRRAENGEPLWHPEDRLVISKDLR